MATAKPSVLFTMVRRSIWGSERFAALPSDAARYVYFYYLTCPHQTASGCFRLKDAYALSDLELTGTKWTGSDYRQVRDALVKGGLIRHDARTGEILVVNWWKDNPPNNGSWIEGSRRQCEAIQSEDLRQAALESLKECEALLASKQNAHQLPRPTAANGHDEKLRTLNRSLTGT
jgi:hypothetical protein